MVVLLLLLGDGEETVAVAPEDRIVFAFSEAAPPSSWVRQREREETYGGRGFSDVHNAIIRVSQVRKRNKLVQA